MSKYSIIIPIYNTEKYLHQCINSVITQTYGNFELILVDDGSSDSCKEICDEYAQLDPRVIVVHKENGGLSDARNAGVKIAKGAYILFLDSDDYWDGNNWLTEIDNAAQETPDIILYRAKKLYETTGRIKDERKRLNIINYKNNNRGGILCALVYNDLFRCSACTKAIRAEIIFNNCIHFEKGLLGEDIDWYLNIVLHANLYAAVDSDFYVYRQREGSITKNFKLKNLTDLLCIISRWVKKLNEVQVNEQTRIALLSYLAKEYSNLFIVYAIVDDVKKADYLKDILNLSWLFAYKSVSRSKIVGSIFKVLGFNITILLLKIASKIRQRI